MNERIKELALQSGAVPLVGHSGLIISNLNVEQFAELIVRECVEVGAQAFLKDNRIVPVFPANQIKQHFGVESKPIIPIEIEPHTCPYKTELYGDETLCTCSPEQEHECAMDV